MKRHPWVRIALGSWGTSAAYREVARRWHGLGFGYLFVLLAVLVLLQLVFFRLAYWPQHVAPVLDGLAAQVPPMEIDEGLASVHAEMPYEITDPRTGALAIVLDTTGTLTSLEDTAAQLLLTRDQLLVDGTPGGFLPLDQVGTFRLDAERAAALVQQARRWLPPGLFAFHLVWKLVGGMLAALVLGLLGLLLVELLGLDLSYGATVRLAVVASTPGLMVETLLALVYYASPTWQGLSYGLEQGLQTLLSLALLVFAVQANREDPRALAGG